MPRKFTISLDYTAKRIYLILLLFSIAALQIGYYLEKGFTWGTQNVSIPLLGHLITEFGIAGLVGFLLAKTFEELSKREFRDLAKKERDDIKTDVFHYVYGYGIPKQITDLIDQQILRTPFIRRNMLAQYTLNTIVDGSSNVKYVHVKRKLTYDVENLTDRPQPFPFSAATDKAPVAQLDNLAKFLSLRVEGSSEPFEHKEAALLKMAVERGREKYLEIKAQEIIVLPGPDHTTKITVESQTVRHLEGGNLYLILFNHACDLDLSVRVPEKDVSVVATAYAGNVLKEQRASHDPDLGFYHWNIERPVLAYQGVYIAWQPVNATSNIVVVPSSDHQADQHHVVTH